MDQYSFKGYPCPQCSTCRYYEFTEFKPDGTKWSIPHSCTNQTTQSNAYELYGKNECEFGFGTEAPCQVYVSTSSSSPANKPYSVGRIIGGILLTIIGFALVLAGIGWIVLMTLADGKLQFWVIAVSLIFFVPGIPLGIKGINLLRDKSSVGSYSGSSSSYSSSSSSRPSIAEAMSGWAEDRQSGSHTCGNCTKYSNARGECRLDGSSKSAEDSCSNWC